VIAAHERSGRWVGRLFVVSMVKRGSSRGRGIAVHMYYPLCFGCSLAVDYSGQGGGRYARLMH